MTWLDDVIFLSILWVNSPCWSLHESHIPFPFLFLSWSCTRAFVVSSSLPNNFCGFSSPFEQPVASFTFSFLIFVKKIVLWDWNDGYPLLWLCPSKKNRQPVETKAPYKILSWSKLGLVITGIFLCGLQSIQTKFSASIMLLSQCMCVSGPLFWTWMVSVVQKSIFLHILTVWSTQETKISNIWKKKFHWIFWTKN